MIKITFTKELSNFQLFTWNTLYYFQSNALNNRYSKSIVTPLYDTRNKELQKKKLNDKKYKI